MIGPAPAPCAAPASPWLARPPAPGGALRLFCFPHSGGGAAAYAAWARDLPGAEVCAVELPGHGRRLAEPPCGRMGPLVRAALEGLLPFLRPPFALFGHSLGALVAFELARALERERGLVPEVLFTSGHGAPHLARPRAPLHALPEPALVEAIERLGGTPPGVLRHPELRALFVPVLRADLEVAETYAWEPGPALACPVSSLGGTEDADVDRADLEAWRALTRGGFRLRMIPGDHFFPFAARDRVLAALAADLARPGGAA